MKITIENIPDECEPEIIIRCNEPDESLLQLIYSIKSSNKKLIGVIDSQLHVINPKDVFYFESVDNKVFIYCKDKVFESRLKLYEIEAEYKNGDFFRATKSTILNITKIASISPIFYGKFEASLQNGEKVLISRQYVPVLRKKLGLWGGFIMNLSRYIKDVTKDIFTTCGLLTVAIVLFSSLYSRDMIETSFLLQAILLSCAYTFYKFALINKYDFKKKAQLINFSVFSFLAYSMVIIWLFLFTTNSNIDRRLMILYVLVIGIVKVLVYVMMNINGNIQAKQLNEKLSKYNEGKIWVIKSTFVGLVSLWRGRIHRFSTNMWAYKWI